MARNTTASKKIAARSQKKATVPAKRTRALRKAPKTLAAGALAGSTIGHTARVAKNTAAGTYEGAKNFVSGFLAGLTRGYAGA